MPSPVALRVQVHLHRVQQPRGKRSTARARSTAYKLVATVQDMAGATIGFVQNPS
ncbi:MAG: hypothetical protein ACREM1_00595 [Longimicrobiales bacterium]